MADALRSELLFRRSTRCSKGGCVEVALLPKGGALLRGSKDCSRSLVVGQQEWFHFVAGLKNGEFDL
jgi:Domain of unknown function (DUF397)